MLKIDDKNVVESGNVVLGAGQNLTIVYDGFEIRVSFKLTAGANFTPAATGGADLLMGTDGGALGTIGTFPDILKTGEKLFGLSVVVHTFGDTIQAAKAVSYTIFES